MVEKRTSFSRNNILLLWPTTIQDLFDLGAKTFHPSLCSGDRNTCGIKQLQLVLLKLALALGVEVVDGCEFVGIVGSRDGDPPLLEAVFTRRIGGGSRSRDANSDGGGSAAAGSDDGEGVPSAAKLQFPFHHLVGADGENGAVAPLLGFEKKAFKAGEALGLTVNFLNKRSAAEMQLEETNRAKHFHQAWFAELTKATGGSVEFENLIYFRGETHYIVCTPKRGGLQHFGVFKMMHPSPKLLLARSNIATEKLEELCRTIATFLGIPATCSFAPAAIRSNNVGGGGGGGGSDGGSDGCSDGQLFDFTTKSGAVVPFQYLVATAHDGAEDAKEWQVVQQAGGAAAVVHLVGDTLLAPFWPQGTGANRAFLSAVDTSHFIAQQWTRIHDGSIGGGGGGAADIERTRLRAFELMGRAEAKDLKKGGGLAPASRYSGF